MIKTTDLKKVYRTEEIETLALNKVSLDVKKGEFVAVMDPSGCGKSTLLNLLGLLDAPSGGKYKFMGINIENYTERRRAGLRKGNIGFVFQSFNLVDELRVYENIELSLLYLRVPLKERKRRIMYVLDKMKIAHRKNHFPQQLSGGEQQRVAVSRAVVSEPKLILADEPTGNLDSKHGEEVMKIFTGLHEEGTTIVMVTHSLCYAEYAERIVNLFDGKIIDDNTMERGHV